MNRNVIKLPPPFSLFSLTVRLTKLIQTWSINNKLFQIKKVKSIFSFMFLKKKIFFSNIKRGKLGGEMSGNVLTEVPRRNLKSAVFCLFEKVGEI